MNLKFNSLVMKPSNKKDKIIKRIQQLVPPGSPEPQEPAMLAKLQSLTLELIEAYIADGQLQEDPFVEVRNRGIHLYKAEVCSQLQGKVVLVTGGEGCVGSNLVTKLIQLGVKSVISVDNIRCCDCNETKPIAKQKESIKLYAADVREYNALKYIFDVEKPDIVFHLAAIRIPGVAEVKIKETVTTSILGTQNIIQLCESHGVEKCIFSSTGKASRYFTTEVYAASKKLTEWLFAKAAFEGNVTYGMVRFTHMLDNSAVCEQIENKIQQGNIINIHAPHRYVTAQNVGEALHLLLNALVISQPNRIKILTVRNLGWPVETLEVGLYRLVQSGKHMPIYFQGLLPGYEEPFFLGQFDWSKPTEINLLINALEEPYRTIDASGDIVVTELAPFNINTFTEQLLILKTKLAVEQLPELEIRQVLIAAEREVTRSIFSLTCTTEILKILKWGVNPKKIQAEAIDINIYRDILELLVEQLEGMITKQVLLSAEVTYDEFDELIEIISNLKSIKKQVSYFRSVSKYFREFDCYQKMMQVVPEKLDVSNV